MGSDLERTNREEIAARRAKRQRDPIGRGALRAWGEANALPRSPAAFIACQFADESGRCGAMAVTQLRLAGEQGLNPWRPYVCTPHERHLLSPAVREERTWEVIDRSRSHKEGFPVAK